MAAWRQHPELPAHLFRWSEACACWRLAGDCRRAGQWLAALRLGAWSLLRDPLLPLAHPHPARSTRRWAARRAAHVAGLRIRRIVPVDTVAATLASWSFGRGAGGFSG